MQTFSFSERSKTPSSVTMQAEKRKPFFPAVKIHPKLIVGSAHDPLEHEADEVAGRIMRMPAPECHTCERDKLFRQKRDEDEEKILMKNDSGASSGIEAPPVVNEAIRSTGHPLDTGTRKFFEPRFGHDFKDVRIHTDDVAARSARAIHAQAYTIGNDIVLDSDFYRMNSYSAKTLLAHELAHVVQQNKNITATKNIQRALSNSSRCPSNAHGSPANPLSLISQALQRAVQIALGASNMLTFESITIGISIPPTTLNLYRRRFGDPVAKGRSFINRFSGSSHKSLILAQASEMDFLSARLKRIGDFLNGNMHFVCPGSGNVKLGDCAISKCKTNTVLLSCPSKHHGRMIAACPGFWGQSPDQRAIGIIHEAVHMLYYLGDYDRSPYADTAAKRRREPECYASLAADIFGISPFDPSCPMLNN